MQITKKFPSFYKVIYISFILFLFQAIANSLMGILSQITHQNNRDWAGPVSTMLLFICSGIGALYNKYVKVFRFGTIMYFASLGYTVYVGSSIVFILIGQTQSAWILVVIFLLTSISGFVVSALYNSQFNYINLCANVDNTTIYFAINLAIVQASNIAGNLLSTFTVIKLGQLHYCIMMTVLISVISLGFLFIREVVGKQQLKLQEQAQQSLKTQNINNNTHKNVWRIVPSFFMSGVIIAFVYCQISIIMYKTFQDKSNQYLNSLTFRIFIFQGIGQLLGGCLVIYASDKFNKCKQILTLNNIFAFAVVVCYIGYNLENIYLIGISCFLIGICDCGVFSLDLAIISDEVWGKRGYSFFNFFQCLGVTVSILILLFTDIQIFIGYVILCQIISNVALHSFK